MIPKQLQRKEYRFVRVANAVPGDNTTGKNPIDMDWQNTANYSFDSPEIQNHKGNIGVLTGMGFVVFDCDTQEMKNLAHQLGDTFTVKTGKGEHRYFRSDLTEKQILKDYGKHLGEIQAKGQQVIIPPSVHWSGVKYEVVHDVPMAYVSKEDIMKQISPFVTSANKPISVKELKEVSEGNRNDSLFRLATFHRKAGAKLEETIILCKQTNQEYEPPLSDREVETIVRSAYRGEVPYGIRFMENPKEKPEKEKPIQVSFLNHSNKIAEQVASQEYAVYDTKTCKAEIMGSIDHEGHTYIPIEGDDIKEGAIKLPEKAEPYESLQELIKEIEAHINRYVDVSPVFLRLSSNYVVLTWLYNVVHTVPYIRFRGDTGCGKTRALDVVGGLCYKPIMTSGCITPAPIYRLIKRWRGTLILDESDFKDSSEMAEVIKILNTGIERDRPIIRCNPTDPEKLDFFPTFGPKLLSTRKDFRDKALESRCITEIMRQTRRKDVPDQLPKKFYEEQATLRNKLLMFRFENYGKYDPENVQNINMGDIEPRLRQVTRSMLVFMDESMRKGFLDFLGEYNREMVAERSETFEGQVVQALVTLKELKHENIYPGLIAEHLGGKEAKITPERVGRCLKSLGIRAKKKRIENGTANVIIWDTDNMELLKDRYIPKDVPDVPDVPAHVTEGKQKKISNVPDSPEAHMLRNNRNNRNNTMEELK